MDIMTIDISPSRLSKPSNQLNGEEPNFYILMQIAHMIFQLLQYGNLLKESVEKMFGSAAAFAMRLLEAWRTSTLGTGEIEKLDGRSQIRLDKL